DSPCVTTSPLSHTPWSPASRLSPQPVVWWQPVRRVISVGLAFLPMGYSLAVGKTPPARKLVLTLRRSERQLAQTIGSLTILSWVLLSTTCRTTLISIQ